jgi:hypothetical protein
MEKCVHWTQGYKGQILHLSDQKGGYLRALTLMSSRHTPFPTSLPGSQISWMMIWMFHMLHISQFMGSWSCLVFLLSLPSFPPQFHPPGPSAHCHTHLFHDIIHFLLIHTALPALPPDSPTPFPLSLPTPSCPQCLRCARYPSRAVGYPTSSPESLLLLWSPLLMTLMTSFRQGAASATEPELLPCRTVTEGL